MSRRPVLGHACDVASPAEDSAVVIAVEIQDAQTAKEAFGSDAVADSVGDADATHGRSGYQPFSLVPNPDGVVVCTV